MRNLLLGFCFGGLAMYLANSRAMLEVERVNRNLLSITDTNSGAVTYYDIAQNTPVEAPANIQHNE